MRAAEEFGGHDLQRANRDAHLGKKKISREIKKKESKKKSRERQKGYENSKFARGGKWGKLKRMI